MAGTSIVRNHVFVRMHFLGAVRGFTARSKGLRHIGIIISLRYMCLGIVNQGASGHQALRMKAPLSPGARTYDTLSFTIATENRRTSMAWAQPNKIKRKQNVRMLGNALFPEINIVS